VSAEPGRHRSREQVLEVLRAADVPLRIVEIAERLGVHPNTVRFHLDALMRSNRVEAGAGENGRRGRPATTYRPVVRMDPDGPREYRALAGILAQDLASRPHSSRRAVGIGRRWGRLLAGESSSGPARSPRTSRDRMRRMLRLLGFAPDAHDDPHQIALRSCPFLELAETSTEVVCPIHLGLMRGALEAWQSPVTVDRLDAFVEPDRCVVHLGRAPAGAAT
jgi:predicted ArsR family transcriptional regulator